MWSFPPVGFPPSVGCPDLVVFVSVELVTKLLLGKNTPNPPSSFKKDRPTFGEIEKEVATIQHCEHMKPHSMYTMLLHAAQYFDPSYLEISITQFSTCFSP